MSYIRSGSNPEGLYIFGGIRGIEIYTGQSWKLSNIGPCDNHNMVVPYEEFVEACRQWQEGLEDTIQVGSFCVENQWIRAIDGISAENCDVFNLDETEKHTYFSAVKLSKGDLFCQLYHATWGYVVANVLRQENANDD